MDNKDLIEKIEFFKDCNFRHVAEIRELKARIEELESRCRYKESLVTDCLRLIGRQKTTIDEYAKAVDVTIKGIKEALEKKNS